MSNQNNFVRESGISAENAQGKRIISAQDISKTLDEFGCGPPYEFRTRATRRTTDNNMLNVKLTRADLIKDDTETKDINEVEYTPAISKEVLEAEWSNMFGSKDFYAKLKHFAVTGRLRDFRRFRGICWRVFLECLPSDVNAWKETLTASRAKYKEIKAKYLVDPYAITSPEKQNVHVYNPLSQEDDSPWSQFFKDKKLNEIILQDLDRLFPGMHYFQSKKIKDILLHILFCYARKHPNIGYKQGMHEILAPLVFVLEYDSEVHQFLHDSDNNLLKELVDPDSLEYDAFSLFDHLMEIIEPWYIQIESPVVTAPQSNFVDTNGLPFVQQQSSTPSTAIVRKINKIQESMLKKYDRELYNHLREFEIEPQLYGLRWVRLLFGREFTTMEDILTLWDGIFADGISLDLVDYIYISLICNKRSKLLLSDHSECLKTLMKTPFSKRGAKTVIIEAKQLRDSKLDSTAVRKQRYHHTNEQQRPASKSEHVEPLQSRISGTLQSVLKSGRHPPVRKMVETRSNVKSATHHKQSREEHHDKDFEQKSVETKSQTKSVLVPAFHFFPHDPDDDELFTTSPRARASSGNFLSKLSSKVRSPLKNDMDTLKQDHERLQIQVSQFKTEVDKLQSISVYCGNKMDSYINALQKQMSKDEKSMDIVFLSIAGLKQVRDLLKGSLSFQPSTVEQDSEFSHIDSVLSSLVAETSQEPKTDEFPETLPVPLLADFGHFERQDEYVIVETENDNKFDHSSNQDNTADPERTSVITKDRDDELIIHDPLNSG